jgi:hypothetical protein
MAILIFGISQTMAQTEPKTNSGVYLQLGTSSGFSSEFPKTIFIPQPAIGADFGLIGFRASGQFFKTEPAFDIIEYLAPIKSLITTTGLKENNYNIMIGLTPYLNIGNNAFKIQPGIGLKFLMQDGATATSVYSQPPGTSILKFPDGEANHNLLMIEPNIRSVFGKTSRRFLFYIEAAYTLPVGMIEFTYTSRSLTGVVDSRGNVDLKALLNSKQVTVAEKVISGFVSIGVGIEFMLNSKINREIPFDISENSILIASRNSIGRNNKIPKTSQFNVQIEGLNKDGINDDGIKGTGEPVPGAEIYIELEGELGGEPIANIITDENGELSFESVNIPNFPTLGTLVLTITPSKAFSREKDIPRKKEKIRVKFIKPIDENFRFVLFWESKDIKTQNKGSFAVSGKNST